MHMTARPGQRFSEQGAAGTVPKQEEAARLGETNMAKAVGDTCDERRLRPDHDQVGGEYTRQVEQCLAVVGPHGMALGERGDAGVAGGGMFAQLPGPWRGCG